MKDDGQVEPGASDARRAGGGIRVPAVIAGGVIAVAALGGGLVWRADARTNKVALASSATPVAVVAARGAPYRAEHMYVGTLRPWIDARLGPQFISGYVETVLVRPGATVTKGQVLATLDCRNANAETSALASQARAIGARQVAVMHEAARTNALLDGGFVSPNEAEQKAAQSAAQLAELAAEEANLRKSNLDVNDCIVRAPFDGEVSLRLVDPGAFVRPGVQMIGVVDRSTVRMTADAPESDFDTLAVGAKVTIHVVAIKRDIAATITRRAPSADPGTRTIHFEVDLANDGRRIPVDTTAEVRVPVGEAVPATAVPLSAVTMNDRKATLFTAEGNTARAQTLVELGEVGAYVFFDPAALKPGSMIVTEGRSLLKDGDAVSAQVAKDEPTGAAADVLRAAPPEETRK